MRRPESTEYHAFYAGYVALVPESDILSALESQGKETRTLLSSIDESRGGHRYAPGKWSIRELVGHVTDAERVFGYRAFAIARGETAALPSFDEQGYIATSNYDQWSMADLVESLTSLRKANLLMLRSLDERGWSRIGNANGSPVTPRALAWILVGHERHHGKVLREKYL